MPHDDLGPREPVVPAPVDVQVRTVLRSMVDMVDTIDTIDMSDMSDGVDGAALRDPARLARALLGDSQGLPREAHTLRVLAGALISLGFTVRELTVVGASPVRRTLFAQLGEATDGPRLGFAAHVGATETADMRGAVAGFIAAVARMQETRRPGLPGSLSLLLTTQASDSASPEIAAICDWLVAQGEMPDLCIVGAPTSRDRLGDVIKVGCRGQLHGVVTVEGLAGPTTGLEAAELAVLAGLAAHPVSRLLRFLTRLDEAHLDHGSSHFPRSSLTITAVDVGSQSLMSGAASAAFEIRYNDHHTRVSLESWIERLALAQLGPGHRLELYGTGDTTVKPPGALGEALSEAIAEVTGSCPAIDTGSDATGVRVIGRHCAVVEFGPRNDTMYEADEQDAIAELEQLTRVYQGALSRLAAQARARRARPASHLDASQGTPGRIAPSAVFSSLSICLEAEQAAGSATVGA